MKTDLQIAFENVYKTKEWLGKVGTLSGIGSSIECAKEYLLFLQRFVVENDIRSIIDLGCGDFNLMRHFDFTGITYLGVDIVEFVIQDNIIKYKTDNINFVNSNVVTYTPSSKYDLVIIKDVLQHLSNENITLLLKNIDYAPIAVVTNDVTSNNGECVNGGYRGVNLNIPPFNIETKKLYEFQACDSFKQVDMVSFK
jgi:hypothetical protein